MFTMQLVWESQNESSAVIAQTLEALQESIDLGVFAEPSTATFLGRFYYLFAQRIFKALIPSIRSGLVLGTSSSPHELFKFVSSPLRIQLVAVKFSFDHIWLHTYDCLLQRGRVLNEV